MKHIRHLIVVIVVPALILTVFAVSSVMANGPEGKTTICHSAGGKKYVQITVNDHALPAHMQHGDVLPDEYGDCA